MSNGPCTKDCEHIIVACVPMVHDHKGPTTLCAEDVLDNVIRDMSKY
jgi:hypothetical protein